MVDVDDLRRMLDNGWRVSLFRNDLGTYTAVAVSAEETIDEAMDIERQITDDFGPSAALCRLSEKMIGNILRDN